MRIHTTVFFLILILSGCSSLLTRNKKSSMDLDNTAQSSLSNPPSANYLSARIVTGSGNDDNQGCLWLLKIEDDPKRLLDPVNLPVEFQKAEITVWVEFSGLRRMNRCPEANPVWIQNIVLR
jgi:uncharacterized protein YceK